MTGIVTCGHTRAGLCAVRSLGRARVAVAVASPVRPALAAWSRYATSTLLVPDAGTDAKRFAETVAKEAAGRAASLVLVATDAALWALSRWRDEQPPGVVSVLPPHEAVVRSLDRTALHDRARALGVRCIEVIRVDVQAALEPALARVAAMDVPVIVRPLVAWVERDDGTRRVAESIPVESPAELQALLRAREDLVSGGCAIEPRPAGTWIGYGAVCDHGRVVAEVFQERLRERGDLSGVSTLAKTVPPDEEVRHAARTVLESLSWQGPAFVEMLRTKDGTLLLVNVVGRLWGSLQLSLNAGIDVPMLCHALARGDPLPRETQTAQAGHLWRWVVGDLEVLARRAQRVVRPGTVNRRSLRERLAALSDMVSVDDLLHARPDVFDADDPLPFVLEIEHRVEEARRQRASAKSA